MTPDRIRYAGYRFPCEIIGHAVWLYFRFPELILLCRAPSCNSRWQRCWQVLLSIVIFAGAPCWQITLHKKRKAALRSRLAVSRKSTVFPALSTARYRYFH
jgi:hypothetical protein